MIALHGQVSQYARPTERIQDCRPSLKTYCLRRRLQLTVGGKQRPTVEPHPGFIEARSETAHRNEQRRFGFDNQA